LLEGFCVSRPHLCDELLKYNSESVGFAAACVSKNRDVAVNEPHVPFSLGGNAVILKGSCRRCAAEIAKCEQEIARKVLGEFRVHAGGQTRRPDERPTELPFTFSVADGELQTRVVPIADHPYFTPMPVWGLPGLLEGRLPTTQFQEHKAHVFYWVPPTIRETMGLSDGALGQLPFPEFRINHERYARGIAKIAYCQAVATLGLHGFRRLMLPDLILGRYPCVPHFVGCKLDDPPPPADRNTLHVIQICTENVNGIDLVVGAVRLFANSGVVDHGPPTYEVVVGAPRRR
jgi:hypothetical protein